MDSLAALTGGAPVAGVLLGVMVAASAIGLAVAPGLIEKSLFRPHWLVPNHEYATLLTSGFVHADLTHLLFNAFTFWAFAFGLERASGIAHTFGFWWAVASLDYFMGYSDNMAARKPGDLGAYARRYIVGKPHVVGISITSGDRQRIGLTEGELVGGTP